MAIKHPEKKKNPIAWSNIILLGDNKKIGIRLTKDYLIDFHIETLKLKIAYNEHKVYKMIFDIRADGADQYGINGIELIVDEGEISDYNMANLRLSLDSLKSKFHIKPYLNITEIEPSVINLTCGWSKPRDKKQQDQVDLKFKVLEISSLYIKEKKSKENQWNF